MADPADSRFDRAGSLRGLLQGARVSVFGRDQNKAQAAAAISRETGQRAMASVADVRDPKAIDALFNRATAQIGAPDVVIAGAAGNFMAVAEWFQSGGRHRSARHL